MGRGEGAGEEGESGVGEGRLLEVGEKKVEPGLGLLGCAAQEALLSRRPWLQPAGAAWSPQEGSVLFP